MTQDRAPSDRPPSRPPSQPPGSRPPGQGSSGSASGVIEAGAVTVFVLGDQTYGLAVSATREIVAVENLIDVPRSPPAVLGLFPLRGGALALVDTPAILGLDVETARRKALVIVRGESPLCGITVDAVLGVVRVDTLEITSAEPGREPGAIVGFLTLPDGRIVTLLDTTAVLGRIEALASSN